MRSLVLQGGNWNIELAFHLCRDREDDYPGDEDSLACCRHFINTRGQFVVELFLLGTPGRALRSDTLIHEAVHAASRLAEYLGVSNRIRTKDTEEAVAEIASGVHKVGHHWLSTNCGTSAKDDKVYRGALTKMQQYVEGLL